jgi:hypothetical protein
MRKDWLTKKITVADAEAANMHMPSRHAASPVPFGFRNQRWRALVAKMEEGDELWTFCSPLESWTHLAGSAGIALVRRGEVVDSIVTLMN